MFAHYKVGVHVNDIHGRIKPTDVLIMCSAHKMEFKGTLNVVSMQGGHSLTGMALADHVTKSGLDIRSPNTRLRRLRETNLAVT